MTVQEMREAILTAYTGKAWRMKVDCMEDSQVIAVYHNFKAKGKITTCERRPFYADPPDKPCDPIGDLHKLINHLEKPRPIPEIEGGEQLKFF